MMKQLMNGIAALTFILTAAAIVLYVLGVSWALSLAITFATFFYHFAMRLSVGHIVSRVMGNRSDYTKGWYRLRPFESRLYQKLGVKKWKGKMPAYDPSVFDPKQHSWDQIAQAMCQAEIVHEIIAVLSFLPLFAAIPFGSFPVFFITSALAAMYDLCFVIMQRYNRPRILRLINKKAR